MSSCVTTLRTFMPALPTIFMTMLPQSMSPAWFRDQQQHAVALVGHLDGLEHQLRIRRGENVAYDLDVHHALADEAALRGLMAGAAEGDDGDAVRLSSARLMTRWP